MKILVALVNFPTLPIASGSPRPLELCRLLSKQHELHLACWHTTHLNNELVRMFWEAEMGSENQSLPPELEKHQEELAKYKGIFATISTLPRSAAHKQSRWRGIQRWLSMSPNRLWQYQDPSAYQRMLRFVQRRLEETEPDLVWAGRFPMAEFTLNSRVPLVVDGPDPYSLSALRAAQLASSKLTGLGRRLRVLWWQRFERRVLAQCEAFVLNNETNAQYLIETGLPAAKIRIVPNGVDIDYFSPGPHSDEESDLLVFTGSFRSDFNLDGVMHFLQNTWTLIKQRRPACRLMLIGPEPPDSLKDYASDNVIIAGYVPDIRPCIEKASLYISPMRGGTGVKNKVLVAMAMGKAVVCTSLSSDGINVSDGREVAIADTPAAFAAKVVELLHNPDLRRRMGLLGRQKVVREYSWESKAEEYQQIFMSVIRKSSNQHGHSKLMANAPENSEI